MGCAPKEAQILPLPPGTRSVILASLTTGNAPPTLLGDEPPYSLLTDATSTERVLAIALPRPLEALDLARGPLPASLPRGEGRPIPDYLGLFAGEPGATFEEVPGPVPFDLPSLDWSAVMQRGRCADGESYVTSTCGSTLALPLIEAAPPRLTDESGQCPAGWSAEESPIDRGPTLGSLALIRCVPPARLGCDPAQMQAAGDQACQDLGPPCDPQDPYSPALPRTTTISYVLASAAGNRGDGTRERPFASLAAAATAPRTRVAQVLAIGRGSYDEDLELGGAIDVLGACTQDTVVRGTIRLRGHQGVVANITVRSAAAPALSIDASTTELRGVWAASGAVPSAGLIGGASRVTAERSFFESSPGGAWTVSSSTLSLSHGEVRGAVVLAGGGLHLRDVATSAAQGEVSTVAGGALELEACLLAAQFTLERSALTADRSWFAAPPVPPATSMNSIVATQSRVRLRRSTFDHRVKQLSCPGGDDCVASQVAMVGSQSEFDVEDVLMFAPPPFDTSAQELSSINLGGGGPQLLRRVLSTGGTSAITIADAEVNAADVAIHGGMTGWRLNCPTGCRAVELARVSVSGALRQGIVLGGTYTGTAQDLGAYDCRVGISVEGRAGAVEIRRASVVNAGPGTIALERTLQGHDLLAFTASLRSIDLRGPFRIALSVEVETSLDLSDLMIQGADTGVVLKGTDAPRHIRQATIEAERFGINLDSGVSDLRPLLDHVRIRAPRPIERGASQ